MAIKKALWLVIPTLFYSCNVFAYTFNENFDIEFRLSQGLQCQQIDARLPSAQNDEDGSLDHFSNACRGALPIRITPTLILNEHHQFSTKFAYTLGNGLDEIGILPIASWAVSYENDVKDINGRGRNYVQTAWYKYTRPLSKHHMFHLTIGLIDATDFLDENAFANNEFYQFMSDGFTNSVVHTLPSNDQGVALQWQLCQWTLSLVGMSIGKNEFDKSFQAWGTELSYALQSHVGAGHYRFLVTGTSKDFLTSDETTFQKKLAVGFSFDQAIHDIGIFTRMSWQKEDAAVDYRSLYSLGVQWQGASWNRPHDNLGLAYAYLKGGNLDYRSNHLFELYYKVTFNQYLEFTLDVQRQDVKFAQLDTNQKDPTAWVYSGRLTATL